MLHPYGTEPAGSKRGHVPGRSVLHHEATSGRGRRHRRSRAGHASSATPPSSQARSKGSIRQGQRCLPNPRTARGAIAPPGLRGRTIPPPRHTRSHAGSRPTITAPLIRLRIPDPRHRSRPTLGGCRRVPATPRACEAAKCRHAPAEGAADLCALFSAVPDVDRPGDRPRRVTTPAGVARTGGGYLFTGPTTAARPGLVEVTGGVARSRLPTVVLVWLTHGMRPAGHRGAERLKRVCPARSSAALLAESALV
jgi:hypothetical protein